MESRLWWKGGWQLHWHHVVAHQPATLRLGTCSLPLPDATARELEVKDDFGLACNADLAVAIQPLLGFARVVAHEPDPQKRLHLLTWHSLVLTAQTEPVNGERDLVALVWGGRPHQDLVTWEIAASQIGKLRLRHPALGEWLIQEPGLPMIGAAKPQAGDSHAPPARK